MSTTGKEDRDIDTPFAKRSEREVGNHLPVPHQQVQPLSITRRETRVFPDRVGEDCHLCLPYCRTIERSKRSATERDAMSSRSS